MRVGERFNPYRHPRMRMNALVPLQLLDDQPELSLGAAMLYGLLRAHASENGDCFPSRAALAQRLRVKKHRVTHFIGELKEAGLIKTKPHRAGGSSSYIFIWHECFEEKGKVPLDKDSGGCSEEQGGVDAQAKGVLASGVTVKGKEEKVQLRGSIIQTHAKGVNGCAEGGLGLSEECEDEECEEEKDTSLYQHTLDRASVWNCELHLSDRRVRFLKSLEACPGRLRAVEHALIAHAGQDATEALMRTVNSWEHRGGNPPGLHSKPARKSHKQKLGDMMDQVERELAVELGGK